MGRNVPSPLEMAPALHRRDISTPGHPHTVGLMYCKYGALCIANTSTWVRSTWVRFAPQLTDSTSTHESTSTEQSAARAPGVCGSRRGRRLTFLKNSRGCAKGCAPQAVCAPFCSKVDGFRKLTDLTDTPGSGFRHTRVGVRHVRIRPTLPIFF